MKKKQKPNMAQAYKGLDGKFKINRTGLKAIRPDLLIVFPYEYPTQDSYITIDTEEFSALCPWTGLPDLGVLTVGYVPEQSLLELKSFKYYLLSYRSVGIVQEHAANRILADLVSVLQPKQLSVHLEYQIRGGLRTKVKLDYP